ncbi:hypothetical protein HN51_004257 [Arachis hypogaea]
MLGVGAVLPPPSSSSELNPAIRSEVSFSVGSCLLPHPDKIFGLEIAAYSSMIDWDICAYLCFSFFTSSLLKSTYDYIIALTEQEQEQQGVGGQQSPQMSTVSSLIGFSSASFFTMFQCGSWCTPPHLFDEDRLAIGFLAYSHLKVMMKETFSSIFVNKKQHYQTPVTRDGPSLKVQLCVLKGDFESEDWTVDEFNSNIESPRERKGSLLMGNTAIIFKNVSCCKGSSGVDSQWRSSIRRIH